MLQSEVQGKRANFNIRPSRRLRKGLYMDYNNFISKYRTNPDYQAEQSIRMAKFEEEERMKKQKESHPQPFTILWLDEELKDVTETFFAMDAQDAKKYVKENYSKVPTYGVFYGESTTDENLVFNDTTIDKKNFASQP
jgi:hypothetical protein